MPKNLRGPDEIAFHVGFTSAQLKVTYTALHLLLDGFGRDEREVTTIVREVLDKFPSDLDMRSLTLAAALARQRPAAPVGPSELV
jgi:hypothetical protein